MFSSFEHRDELNTVSLNSYSILLLLSSMDYSLSQQSSLDILLTLLEEKFLYRTLKGSISATYLEPLKGSIHS